MGPAKAQSNARKHDITFDQAATVFLDALALTVYDESNSQDEERWLAFGFDASGKLLAVTHTYRLDHCPDTHYFSTEGDETRAT